MTFIEGMRNESYWSMMKPWLVFFGLAHGVVALVARVIALSWSSLSAPLDWNFFPVKWLKAMVPLEGNNFNGKTCNGLSKWGERHLSIPLRTYRINGNHLFLFRKNSSFIKLFLWTTSTKQVLMGPVTAHGWSNHCSSCALGFCWV